MRLRGWAMSAPGGTAAWRRSGATWPHGADLPRGSAEQHRGQATKVVQTRVGRVGAAQLHADVVGARVEVFADARGDRLLVAPGDHGVDHAVGAGGGDVLVTESKPEQV